MPKFKTLDALQAYLEKNVHHVMNRSAELERVLSDEMSQAVWDVVYAGYISPPEVENPYERRMDDGGLSDVRNMEIVSVTVENGKIRLLFENTAQGNDSMSGKFISDTIIEGIKENWSNPNGSWTDPRDYVSETVRRLKENPEELANAIREGLIAKGMKIRN